MINRILTVFIIGLFLFGGYIAYTAVTLPSVRKNIESQITPTQTSQILAKDGSVIMSYGKYQHIPVSINNIPQNLIDALISTEDRRFYMHKGLDPLGILRAIVTDVKTNGIHEGGSTITQQLARNLFLSNERSFQRKIKEALLAIKIEQQLSKSQILELYFNNVYFGEGAYGIGAASAIYFGKSPSQLNLAECALLAGLPQAPSLYNPFTNPELALKRRKEVLHNLAVTGKISETRAEKLSHAGLHLNPNGRALANADKAPFFNHQVIQAVLDKLDLSEQSFWQQDLRVYTTLDARAQTIAEEQLRQISAAYGRNSPNQQAALFSLNNEGGVIAYVGGKDFLVSQFDRVSQAKRLAGSLFKVFVYTTAIQHGIQPSSVFRDSPVQFGNWAPENYDKSHRGLMTVAQAIAHSNNIIAIKVTHAVTPEAVIQTAQQMGITAVMDPNLSLALGAVDVTLREMTTAFSILANNGVVFTPYFIEKIVDKQGKVIYQHQIEKRLVLQRVPRDTMVGLMQGVVRFGTGKAADIGRPVAGKTGTSDDYRDAWFIGFTPEVTTGVWVGNDDNTQMPGITGGSIPARIWHGYMSRLLSGTPVHNFDVTYSLPIADKDFFAYDVKNISPSETPASSQEVQNANSASVESPTATVDPGTQIPVSPQADQDELPPTMVPKDDHLKTPPPNVPVEQDRYFDFQPNGQPRERFTPPSGALPQPMQRYNSGSSQSQPDNSSQPYTYPANNR